MATLSRDECLQALTSGSVGRIAITAQALPAIVPVSYAMDGHTIVFRTKADGMLARACDGNVVAFEIDHLWPDGRVRWSVMAVGVASLLEGSQAIRALELNLASAAGEDRNQFVAITIGRISGRCIGDAAYGGNAMDVAFPGSFGPALCAGDVSG
jgi:nitroimidazol reductase NimA-like FMN-containing flavoprotein (pyridoxamine 5'-phosphate oxidase superfamily)